MQRRESLLDYQAALQAQMERARFSAEVTTALYVGIVVNGENYLIDARHVAEVAESSTLLPIPIGRPWAAGVANIKGAVCAVTDLSLLVGGPPTRQGKFLVLQEDLVPGSALLISGLSGLYEDDAIGAQKPFARPAEMPAWVTGYHNIEGQEFRLIDGEKLATDSKFTDLQSGEHHDDVQG